VGGAFRFLSVGRSGQPVRYNPCAPVRYVINPDGAPDGAAVDEVHEAFRQLGEATGISFTFAGTTDERHLSVGGATRRASYQPTRYGLGAWAPVLVSWTGAGDEPVLAGSTLGYGGSTYYSIAGSDPSFVTGEVVLDTDLRPLRAGFGSGLTRGTLLLHELGHVVGLDHVDDSNQIMNPAVTSRGPGGYADGDRAGLAQLGRDAGCLKALLPS
jgi:hypothetical protein